MLEIPNLFTVKQFCLNHSWPSESALRAMILRSQNNGFKSAFKKCGRRVLIDEQEFFKCLNQLQNQEVVDGM